MAQVLVDTSALVAFFVQSEKHHLAVKNYVLEHPTVRWVILSSVFDETVTWLRLRVSVPASIEIGRVLREEHTYITLSDTLRCQKQMIVLYGKPSVVMMISFGTIPIVHC